MKNTMCTKSPLAIGLFVCLLTSGFSRAALTLIDPVTNNGSFEYVNGVPKPGNHGDKITGWDNVGNDIDNWTLWTEVATASNDSGTQVWTPAPAPPAGPEGIWFSFLQPGNAIYNLTTYTAEEGDVFEFSWDNIGTKWWSSHSVSLVYFDGTNVVEIPGSKVTIFAGTDAGSGGQSQTHTNSFEILGDSPAIGYTIGLGVIGIADWSEVDNFNLSVVPEPSTAIFAGMLGLFVFGRILSRRRAAC